MERDSGIVGGTLLALSYLGWVASVRMASYYKLDSITPPKDAAEAHAVVSQFVYYDFPFIATKALEFGLFKTYGIPSISKLLVSTKELTMNYARRYDDTDILVREFVEQPPDSWRAELAIRRLNALHGKYTISNEDYLYVLCIFAVEPIRWVDKYGFRKSHDIERLSLHLIWKDVGTKMGIKNIQNSYEEMEEYLDKFERENMKFNQNNVLVAEGTVALLLSNVPSFLHPLGRRVVHAMCDSRLRAAMGFPEPVFLLPELIHVGLTIAGWGTRLLLSPRTIPARRTPRSPADAQSGPVMGLRLCPLYHPYEPTYKRDGYCIEQLGPEKYAAAQELGPLHRA
jgi:hypothetical protein